MIWTRKARNSTEVKTFDLDGVWWSYGAAAVAVSRLVCRSENYEMSLTLDVNVDLLPVEREYKFSIELASTLNLDGTPDSGVYEKRDARSSETRLSGCDYAMHGKVFKYDHVNYSKVYARALPLS